MLTGYGFRAPSSALIAAIWRAELEEGGVDRGQVSLHLRYGVSRRGAVECGRHELNRGRARFGWANLAQLLDEPTSPAIDVVFTHCGPHPLHTHAALFGTHLQRLADAVGQLLGVIRVYLERIAQFMRCPREAAEDQDAVQVVTRCDKFLGDKIHSIVQ